MRTKLLTLLAVLSVMGSMVVSTQAVLADGWATANATANGTGHIATSSAGSGTGTYSIATADNSYSTSQTVSGTSSDKGNLAATTTSDSESLAVVNISANTPETGNGEVIISGDTDATNGASSTEYIYAFVNDRSANDAAAIVNVNVQSNASGFGASSSIDADQGLDEEVTGIGIDKMSSGKVTVNVISSADGERAKSLTQIGVVNINTGSSGSVDAEISIISQGANADVEAYVGECVISASSSGTAVVDITASAMGDDTTVFMLPSFSVISGYSSGEATVLVDASATGGGAACTINSGNAWIYDYSSGSASTSIQASSTGQGSRVFVPYATSMISKGGSGEVDTAVVAAADNGGLAVASGAGYASGVDADIRVYSSAEASGTGAYSTSEVNISNGAPRGFYLDVASDDYGFAIAFVVAFGDNNVIAVGYSYTVGGSAQTVVIASPAGVYVDAMVGFMGNS